jgi:cytochrome c
MSKRIITLAVMAICVLAVGMFFGNRWHAEQKFMEAITPHVKNTSLRVINASQYELSKDSKITFKELFEKLEGDVSEIDKRVLDVQTLETEAFKQKSEPVVAYLKASQELLRAQVSKYRKTLAVSNSLDWVTQRIADAKNERWGYGAEYALKAARKAVDDLGKGEKELSEARESLLASLKKMIDARQKLEGGFPGDALIPVSLLEEVVKANEEKAKEEVKAESGGERQPYAKPTKVANAADKAGDPAVLAKEKNCLACHSLDAKIVGPAYRKVAAKYRGDAGAAATLTKKVLNGGKGVWGEVPMPPNSGQVSEEEAKQLVTWILGL